MRQRVGQVGALRAALEHAVVALQRGRRLIGLAERQVAVDQHRRQRGEDALVAEPLGARDVGLELRDRRGRLAKPAQVVQRPGGVELLGLVGGERLQALHQRFVGHSRIVGDVVLVQGEAQRELVFPAPRRGADRGRLFEQAARLGDARALGAAPRRLAQRCDRLLVFAGGDPVPGHPRRLARMRGEPACHGRVRVARDLGRHGRERGLVDQIVREAAVAQHLRRFELAPGARELQGRLRQHALGELDAEVERRDRRQPRQGQGHRRKLRQAPLDELLHRLRPRRRLARCQHRQAAVGPGLLQGLEHEQRIAAGALQQVGSEVDATHAGQRERVDELRDLAFVERRQGHARRNGDVEQGVVERAQMGSGFRGPVGQHPAQRARARAIVTRVARPFVVGVDQRLQHLERGRIGEVQVVDEQPVERRRRAEQRAHRALQHVALAFALAGPPCSPFGQDARDLVAYRRQQDRHGAVLRLLEHGAQQPRQGGERHAGIARPAGAAHRVRLAFGKGIEQPRLAQARLAEHGAHPPRAPCLLQRFELAHAADQARRAQHAHRQRPARGFGRVLGERFDARAQRFGLGVGRDAEYALEHVAAVIEGGECRGTVAAQVVQPHDAAVRMLGGGIALDELLCGGQRQGELPGALVARGGIGQPLGALGAALLARCAQPRPEPARVGLGHADEQLARGAALAVEVDGDVGAQARHGGAFEQVDAQELPQAKAPLAQIGERALLVDVGPEHRRQRGARRRALDREIGEQERVLALRRDGAPIARPAHRFTDQTQTQGIHSLDTERRPRGLLRHVL